MGCDLRPGGRGDDALNRDDAATPAPVRGRPSRSATPKKVAVPMLNPTRQSHRPCPQRRRTSPSATSSTISSMSRGSAAATPMPSPESARWTSVRCPLPEVSLHSDLFAPSIIEASSVAHWIEGPGRAVGLIALASELAPEVSASIHSEHVISLRRPSDLHRIRHAQTDHRHLARASASRWYRSRSSIFLADDFCSRTLSRLNGVPSWLVSSDHQRAQSRPALSVPRVDSIPIRQERQDRTLVAFGVLMANTCCGSGHDADRFNPMTMTTRPNCMVDPNSVYVARRCRPCRSRIRSRLLSARSWARRSNLHLLPRRGVAALHELGSCSISLSRLRSVPRTSHRSAAIDILSISHFAARCTSSAELLHFLHITLLYNSPLPAQSSTT